MAKTLKVTSGQRRPAELKQCAELLRYLPYPRRLRRNPLAQEIWSSADLSPETALESDLARCLENSVRFWLKALSPRQAAIIERCTLAGEINSKVAAELGISLRHLYREQKAAIAILGSRLGHERTAEQPVIQVSPDATGVQLALSETLEQNGQWAAAAELLERLAFGLSDASNCSLVEYRLAGLYRYAGRYSLADEHVRRAFQLSSGSTAPAWLKAAAAVSAARLSATLGDNATAERVARHCTMELRSWNHSGRTPQIAEALLTALNLLTDISIGRGNAARAAPTAAEALEISRQIETASHEWRIDINAEMEAHVQAAMAATLTGKAEKAEQLLCVSYVRAAKRGRTRHILAIAAMLAVLFRLTGRSREALDLLAPLLDVARSVGSGDTFGGFFIEFGSAAADLGDLELARSCMVELRNRAGLSAWIGAHMALYEAQIGLMERRYDASLKASEAAESAFMSLGNDRLVGPSLQLQAQALAALGETSRAVRTMRLAVRRLEATGHHYTRLIEAYLSMASLTGDSAFRQKARKTKATLERVRSRARSLRGSAGSPIS